MLAASSKNVQLAFLVTYHRQGYVKELQPDHTFVISLFTVPVPHRSAFLEKCSDSFFCILVFYIYNLVSM